jgi:hypothetical protein
MHYKIRLAPTAGGYIQMQLAVHFCDASTHTNGEDDEGEEEYNVDCPRVGPGP